MTGITKTLGPNGWIVRNEREGCFLHADAYSEKQLGPTGWRVTASADDCKLLDEDQEDLAGWFRYGVGITATNGLVSQWDDVSGNGRHLKQATETNRPGLQADGSILFDGVDNYLKCDAFTLNQPETVYLLFRQVTWTSGGHVFDGNAGDSGRVVQFNATPAIRVSAGSSVAQNGNLAVNTYGAIAVVINGASSLIQVNSTTATTGNAGANNMGGFTLGASGAAAAFGNIQVKEAVVYAAAHDADQRARIIEYLSDVAIRGTGPLNGLTIASLPA
jgi:hypothetical protein